jgi:GT2 family glycosyltransferase/SAM-dependent methyltransferase
VAVEPHKQAELSRDEAALDLEEGKPFGPEWESDWWSKWVTIREILRRLELPVGASLLHVGCGAGWLSLLLAQSGYRVTGIDLVPGQVERAARRARELSLSARFEVRDFESFELDERFDAAIAFDALHHSSRRAAVAHCVSNHLRPGGWMVVGEPSWLNWISFDARRVRREKGWLERGVTVGGLRRDLRAAGLTEARRFFEGTQPYEARVRGFGWQLARLVAANFAVAPRSHIWLAARRSPARTGDELLAESTASAAVEVLNRGGNGAPASAGTKKVAAIVVSWNGRDDTIRCLESLSEAHHEQLTVVVVDNASTDGTAEAVRAAFPDVDLLRASRNLGFAEGNNVGVRHALVQGADYVMLLNNDTVVERGCLRALLKAAEAKGDRGAFSPVISYAADPEAIWWAGTRFNPKSVMPRARITRTLEPAAGQGGNVEATDCVTGCAMLIPRRVFEDVGELDAQLFFVFEDVDWSLRARERGYPCYVVTGARIAHAVSASSGGERSPLQAYYGTRNALAVAARHGAGGPVAQPVRLAAVAALHLLWCRHAPHRLAAARGVLAGLHDFRRRSFGPRPQELSSNPSPPSPSGHRRPVPLASADGDPADS